MTWWRVLDSDSDRMAPKQNESLFMHNTVCYITLNLYIGGYALCLFHKMRPLFGCDRAATFTYS